ncbi:type VI secretion system tip protein VgrG [Paracoccus methylarcula]|uniref:Type VI secretion system tip protein VgrG n=1 Tax=Paracoccus methylarcula TaxID=72022 RepID=A0A3R7NBK1_9RHOB|nr:type VI secretion system tip protein VgrG [Paracoccus methylarcula]
MDGTFSQSGRVGRLSTVLGEDALALLRFDGTDRMNDLFEYRVEALATQDDLDFDQLIGTQATVEIEAHETMRPFSGIVTSAQWAGAGENGFKYALTLRPWLYLAGLRRNQRIWHRKTVEQILRELFADYAHLGDPAFEIKLAFDYPELEYTVQYSENDMDFARRLMERFGISYYFQHVTGSHKMVITDDELNLALIGERPFHPADRHHQAEEEHFWSWEPERNVTTGAVRQVDYNFKAPYQSMETRHMGDAAYPEGRIESYEYPGDYLSEDVGKVITRMKVRQERGADRRIRAVGDCVSLTSGYRFKLGGDKVPGHGEAFVCLSATHSFVSEAYGTGDAGSDGYSYSGSYVLMPDTAPMVPPKRTPLSRIYGPQTAMVVGEGEIDVDEYGRILVQFHWDLDKSYSMRCRVSQNWSGNGWGGIVIPRIGMEVVVEFLEGDPDKPLVTGCVYNGRNKVPYALSEHKTRSTFRTNTHQGDGFNELRFEDQVDQEEIYLHAQRDMNIWTLRNRSELTEGNQSQRTLGDKYERIDESSRVEVVGNIDISAGHEGNLIGAAALLPHGYEFRTHPERYEKARANWPDDNGSIRIQAQNDIAVLSGNTLTLGSTETTDVSTAGHLTINAIKRISMKASRMLSIISDASASIRAAAGVRMTNKKSGLIFDADGNVTIYGKSLNIRIDGDVKVTGRKINLN